jgi:hypothetical protein
MRTPVTLTWYNTSQKTKERKTKERKIKERRLNQRTIITYKKTETGTIPTVTATILSCITLLIQ